MKNTNFNKIACGVLMVATLGEMCLLGSNVYSLEKEVNHVHQELKIKQEMMQELNEKIKNKEINIKDLKEEIKKKDVDIDVLQEERKLYMEEIEKLKGNNEDYSNTTVSFNENNLTTKSGADTKRINKILEGTGLSGLGSSYIQAEETYGVNAMFLASLTAQESGWGESNRANTQNNLSGYAVYSSASAGTSFSSKHESIMATAKLLSNDYLNSKGAHYSGKDIYSVNEVYCPNDDYYWANSITKIAYKLTNQINNL